MEPLFPEIVVELALQEGRPVASIALVRRALQKAGHRQAANDFTAEAMAEDEAGIAATARKYVTVA